MTSQYQGDSNFGIFRTNGMFLGLIFMYLFWGALPLLNDQILEKGNFKNPTTQISAKNSHDFPHHGPNHFFEKNGEKEEEKQEDDLFEFTFDTGSKSFVSGSFINSSVPKISFCRNSGLFNQIPFYILFQNLKLDLI